jgi:hypothetical protein
MYIIKKFIFKLSIQFHKLYYYKIWSVTQLGCNIVNI